MVLYNCPLAPLLPQVVQGIITGKGVQDSRSPPKQGRSPRRDLLRAERTGHPALAWSSPSVRAWLSATATRRLLAPSAACASFSHRLPSAVSGLSPRGVLRCGAEGQGRQAEGAAGRVAEVRQKHGESGARGDVPR